MRMYIVCHRVSATISVHPQLPLTKTRKTRPGPRWGVSTLPRPLTGYRGGDGMRKRAKGHKVERG